MAPLTLNQAEWIALSDAKVIAAITKPFNAKPEYLLIRK
jgi:hypothetical protein